MKKLLRKVYAGISGKYDENSKRYKFSVDFDKNDNDDVVKFIEPFFRQSSIDGNTYWFGYSFNDGQPNPRRDEFIQFLKHVQPEKLVDPEDEWSGIEYNDESITETDLASMIIRSLDRIRLRRFSVDTIVYPESKSGNLVNMIVRCISRYVESAKKVSLEEFQKNDASEIDFDFARFEEDLVDDTIDVPDFVNDQYIHNMLSRARSADTFSLRKYIKPAVLRNYVSNFYKINKDISAIINSDVVLVVDDFGTTGTTIRELIRNIRELNQDCEIYIFTLMGNMRRK